MNQKIKRIAAWIGIILLTGLSIVSLIVAFLDFEGKLQVLYSCLASAVFLPILIWIFIWLYGVITKKKNIASFRSEEMEETMKRADQIREESKQNEEK